MDEQQAQPAAIAELYTLWSIQDALLQNYRMLFITVQSIFLSVATAVASSGAPWASLFIALSGLFIMTKWTTFTRIRGHCVDIAQDMIREAESGKPVIQPLQRFKDIQRDMKAAAPKRQQKTRYWLEVQLPRFFWGAWFLLIIASAVMLFLRTRWSAPLHEIINQTLAHVTI
jgi:K+ transporter